MLVYTYTCYVSTIWQLMSITFFLVLSTFQDIIRGKPTITIRTKVINVLVLIEIYLIVSLNHY